MSIAIIDELRELRDEQGISHKDIAEGSGISEANISKIFSGKNDNPSIQTLIDIADTLGVEIGVLKAQAQSKAFTSEILLYRRMIKDRDQIITEKNRWIRNLAIICAIIGGAFVTWLLVDVLNGNIGFIRY